VKGGVSVNSRNIRKKVVGAEVFRIGYLLGIQSLIPQERADEITAKRSKKGVGVRENFITRSL